MSTPRGADHVATLDPGDEVSVTIGRELYSPIRYQTFEVGPYTVVTKVRPGETAREAFARARAVAQEAWDQEFEEKVGQHGDRVSRAADAVRS